LAYQSARSGLEPPGEPDSDTRGTADDEHGEDTLAQQESALSAYHQAASSHRQLFGDNAGKLRPLVA